jgi:hypothetical protein
LCGPADADATFIKTMLILQMTPTVSFPLPPAGQAIVDADPPHSATTHALQLPEVIARRATAGVVLLVGGATTATALATSEASPVAASRPLELIVEVGPDELEDRLGRDLGVDEQGGPFDHGVRRRPRRPRVGTSRRFWSHARRAHRGDPPKHTDIIG